MAQETVVNPGILPEQPVQMELVDDQTVTFRPQFGRAWTQRNTYADPRWRMRLKFRGLRSWERAQLLLAMNEARGGFATVRVTPYQVRRGTFPATEILTKSTYFADTSAFTANNDVSITAVDGMIRVQVTENVGSDAAYIGHPAVTITDYAPYVIRVAQLAPSNPDLYYGIYYDGFFQKTVNYTLGASGILSTAGNTAQGSTHLPVFVSFLNGGTLDGHKAGDHYMMPYASMTRCALVDAGQNLLLQSDQLSTTWTTLNGTVTANNATSPTGVASGNAMADRFTENTVNNAHYVSQTLTLPTEAGSYTFSVAVKYVSAQWMFIEMTGIVFSYLDVLNGTLGVSGGSGTKGQVSLANIGNGWYRLSVSALKAAGVTSSTLAIGTASANGTSSFTGTSRSILISRPTMTKGHHATQLVPTTTAAVDYTQAPSGKLNVMGLPASTANLLLSGDFIEINGELKQITATLSSAADGTGTLAFRPGMYKQPVHGDPVIIHNPMGRFALSDAIGYESLFGSYADLSLTLDEVAL